MDDIEKILDARFQDFKAGLLLAVKELHRDKSPSVDSLYIDVSDVSQLMNVSKKTVRKYYSLGKLIGEKELSGRLRFKREDVEKFILNIQKDKYGIQRSK